MKLSNGIFSKIQVQIVSLSSSDSRTTPNFEKKVVHLRHMKVSGSLFHNLPDAPHKGHLYSESIPAPYLMNKPENRKSWFR